MAIKKKSKKVKKTEKTKTYNEGVTDATNFVLELFMNELFVTDTPRTALSPRAMEEKCKYVANRVKEKFKC